MTSTSVDVVVVVVVAAGVAVVVAAVVDAVAVVLLLMLLMFFVVAVSAAMASRVRQGNSLFSSQHYNHAAHFLFSASMPLRRCMAVESLSLGTVPRNT